MSNPVFHPTPAEREVAKKELAEHQQKIEELKEQKAALEKGLEDAKTKHADEVKKQVDELEKKMEPMKAALEDPKKELKDLSQKAQDLAKAKKEISKTVDAALKEQKEARAAAAAATDELKEEAEKAKAEVEKKVGELIKKEDAAEAAAKEAQKAVEAQILKVKKLQDPLDELLKEKKALERSKPPDEAEIKRIASQITALDKRTPVLETKDELFKALGYCDASKEPVAHGGPCPKCPGDEAPIHEIPRTEDAVNLVKALQEKIDGMVNDFKAADVLPPSVEKTAALEKLAGEAAKVGLTNDSLKALAEKGRMLGVLICEDEKGALQYLYSFSSALPTAPDAKWKDDGSFEPMGGKWARTDTVKNTFDFEGNPVTFDDSDKIGSDPGNCAAPKMIDAATRLNKETGSKLKPVGIAEVWMGAASESQNTGEFYNSCPTCQNILGKQLHGI